MMEAVITQSEKDSQWYAEFKGGNHETWFVSEGYPTIEIGTQSVFDFCERIGATSQLHVKTIGKDGSLIDNFFINVPTEPNA